MNFQSQEIAPRPMTVTAEPLMTLVGDKQQQKGKTSRLLIKTTEEEKKTKRSKALADTMQLHPRNYTNSSQVKVTAARDPERLSKDRKAKHNLSYTNA